MYSLTESQTAMIMREIVFTFGLPMTKALQEYSLVLISAEKSKEKFTTYGTGIRNMLKVYLPNTRDLLAANFDVLVNTIVSCFMDFGEDEESIKDFIDFFANGFLDDYLKDI